MKSVVWSQEADKTLSYFNLNLCAHFTPANNLQKVKTENQPNRRNSACGPTSAKTSWQISNKSRFIVALMPSVSVCNRARRVSTRPKMALPTLFFGVWGGTHTRARIKARVPGIPRGASTSRGGATGMGRRRTRRHLFENDTWPWLAGKRHSRSPSDRQRRGCQAAGI